MSEFPLEGALSSQSSASTGDRRLGDSGDSKHDSMPGLGSESKDGDKTDNFQKEMGAMTEIVCTITDCRTRSCTVTDQALMQKDCTECNLPSLKLVENVMSENRDTATFCDREYTPARTFSADACDVEKHVNQNDCLLSKQNNGGFQEMELTQSIDDLALESPDSCIEGRDLLDDGKTMVRAEILASVCAGDSVEKAHIGDELDSVLKANLHAFSTDEFCKEGEESHINSSNASTLSVGLYDHGANCDTGSATSACESLDMKHCEGKGTHSEVGQMCNSVFPSETMVTAENGDSVSPLAKEVCDASLANFLHDMRNGDTNSAASMQCVQDIKHSEDDKDYKDKGKTCDPMIDARSKVAGESLETIVGCEHMVSHENVFDENTLPVMIDARINECVSSGEIVSIDNAITESGKDYPSNDRLDLVLEPAANVWLPTAASSVTKTSAREEEIVQAQSSANYRSVETPLSFQIEEEGASSSCQHQECMGEENGGNSLCPAAEKKPQQSDECVHVEDEGLRSVVGEEITRTPIQPLKQQRKKIDIHHQFVREIVKIQYDREQYDRERAERQIQAQQAASLLDVGSKSSDNKVKIQLEQEQYTMEQSDRPIQSEQAANLLQVGCKSSIMQECSGTFSEMPEIKGKTNKQKLLKESVVLKQEKESHRKSKHEKLIQSTNEISTKGNPPQNSHEQVRPAFLTVKEEKKISRSKQQRPVSIYRPPLAREALEHTKLEDSEAFNKQSPTSVINSLPENVSFMPVVSKTCLSEGQSKVGGGTFRDCYKDGRDLQADQSASSMGIKVTSDTEKRQRHIQLSGRSSNAPKGELASTLVSHSIPGPRPNKESKMNPPLDNGLQASKFLPKSRRQIENGDTLFKGNDDYAAQVVRNSNPLSSHQFQGSRILPGRVHEYGERSSKVSDHNFVQSARMGDTSIRHFRQDSSSTSSSRLIDHGEVSNNNIHCSVQVARMGSMQSFSPEEALKSRERAGKSSDESTEKKNSFFKWADNGANLHNLDSWFHKSRPLVQHGGDGQTLSDNRSRQPDWFEKAPIASSQNFSDPISQQRSAMWPSFEQSMVDMTTVTTTNVRGEEFKRSLVNMHGNPRHQQFNNSRSHDLRENQRNNSAVDNSRLKNDASRKATEFCSPVPVMLKDMSGSGSNFAMPAQRSSDTNRDSRGLGKSWPAKDRLQTNENLQESLRKSQSDDSRNACMQHLQTQSTSSPVRKSLICITPIQEKWGDVVDDSPDSYDYLQFNIEDDRESKPGSLTYRGANQSNTGLVNSELETPVFQDESQDRILSRNSFNEAGGLQKRTELAKEHFKYQTPRRKSVFERLGPQTNFQESILGPPPKMLDNRGVLKSSPDALINNVQHSGNFRGFDARVYGSQWASPTQAPTVQHENAKNNGSKGQEVVIQAYTELKQRRSKRELYVPRRGSQHPLT